MRSHGGAVPSPPPRPPQRSDRGSELARSRLPAPPCASPALGGAGGGGRGGPSPTLVGSPRSGERPGQGPRGATAAASSPFLSPLLRTGWPEPWVRLGASGSCPRVLPGERRQQLTGVLLLDPSGRGWRERDGQGPPLPPGTQPRAPRPPPASPAGRGV